MKNAGFSLIDIILATATIMVLVVLASPSVIDYLDMEKQHRENEIQTEILRAMRAYAQDHGKLPTGTDDATTENDLTVLIQALIPNNDTQTRYTALEPNDLLIDAWGNQRYYRLIQETKNYQETDFPVQYAIVFSYGYGNCREDTHETVCEIGDEEHVNTFMETVTAFHRLSAAEGDFLLKYTDFEVKEKQLNQTRKRLRRIHDALSEYATLKRYEGIANGLDENWIYLPRSSVSPVDGDSGVTHEISSSDIVSEILVDGSDEQRRESMRQLMRLIGVPEENCCTPLYKDSDGEDAAFYYYSNPRPRTIDGAGNRACGTRPSFAGLGQYYLPPRIIVGDKGANNTTFHNEPEVCG